MNVLESMLGDTPLAIFLSALLILIGAFLGGKIVKLLLHLVGKKVSKRAASSLNERLLTVLEHFVVGFVTVVTLYWTLKGIGRTMTDVPVYVVKILNGAIGAMYVIMIMYSAFVVSRIIDAIVTWYLNNVAARTETHLDDELAPLVNRVLNILVYVVGVIIILDHFQQDISTLVVSLGVGSLAIALAAQETLANMIAGFVLMIDRPFRVGDRICLPDGSIGNVSEIGIRSTKVIDDYQVMIITPNAEIVKSQIMNFSYPNDVVRFEVPFGVAYGSNLEQMRAVVIEAINSESDIVDPHTTEVRILEMDDSSVNTKLLCKIKNPNYIPRRKSDLLLLIYNTLYLHRIEIPFPQRVLHFGESARELFGRKKDQEP